MIQRRIQKDIIKSLTYFPVAAIVGPRQVGKTTLAKQLISVLQTPSIYLDLEKVSDVNKLRDAEFFLSQNKDKLIVIDEVQIRKDLFPLLRSIVDETNKPGQFLLLGSASPDLIRDSSESLAGRIAYHRLHPLNINEVDKFASQNDLWIKGGFPKALLAPENELTWEWMENFVDTYLQRDLIQLGLNVHPLTIRNLWSMLAHQNGNLLNATTLGNSLGVSTPTVKKYIDFLENAFLLKSLHPFSVNMKKRLVKSPKVYISDSGILHYLLGVASFNELAGHPIVGSSWESFVINQITSNKRKGEELFFYRTHHGAEADLVLAKGNSVKAAIEIKFTNSPKLTKGNFIAFEDLGASINFVITPSSDDYLIKEDVRICSLRSFIFNYLPGL